MAGRDPSCNLGSAFIFSAASSDYFAATRNRPLVPAASTAQVARHADLHHISGILRRAWGIQVRVSGW